MCDALRAQDYTCTAFPNDDNSVDSFIVGLISLAIGASCARRLWLARLACVAHSRAPGCAAIPVTVFITTCFGIANDNEAPESWLEWVGWPKLVFGLNAHRRWHFTRGAPPVRYVKWYVRSKDAPQSETAANLWRSFWAFVTGTEPPWVIEAREAAEEEAAEAAKADGEEAEGAEKGEEGAKAEEEAAEGGSHKAGSHKSRSTTSSVRSAKALSSYKRQVMVVGLIATMICWAIFVWFIFTCACTRLGAPPALCVASHAAASRPARRRHAHLPLARRGRAAVVCALVGHQLRHQRGGRGMRTPRIAAACKQLTCCACAFSGRTLPQRRRRASSFWPSLSACT